MYCLCIPCCSKCWPLVNTALFARRRCELYFPQPGEPVVLLRSGVLLHLRRCMQALGLEPPDVAAPDKGASVPTGAPVPKPTRSPHQPSASVSADAGPRSPPGAGCYAAASAEDEREDRSPAPGRGRGRSAGADAHGATGGSSGGGRTPEAADRSGSAAPGEAGFDAGSRQDPDAERSGCSSAAAASGRSNRGAEEDGGEDGGDAGQSVQRGQPPAAGGGLEQGPRAAEAPPVPEAVREAVRVQWEALRAAVAALRPFERFRVVSVAYRRCACLALSVLPRP